MSAALKLELFENGELLKEIPLEQKIFSIGRGNRCDLNLDHRAISRKHVSLRPNSQGLQVDKESEFGSVKVNGKEIEQALLKFGDRIELGPYEIRVAKLAVLALVEHTQTLIQASSEKTPELAPEVQDLAEFEMSSEMPAGVEDLPTPEMPAPFEPAHEESEVSPRDSTGAFDFAKVETDGVTKVFQSEQKAIKAVLEFSDGAANVSRYELNAAEIAIGRSQKCHIVLEDKRSSRKHSLILKRNQKFYVKDLGSANGTLVNAVRVDEQELQSGDEIQIGNTRFHFQIVQADFEEKKQQFMSVPEAEIAVSPPTPVADFAFGISEAPMPNAQAIPLSEPAFSAPQTKKRSLIGGYIDRFRSASTKRQIIYAALVASVMYMLLFDDESTQPRARLNTGEQKKVVQKKNEKSMGQSFESLTPEQQHYIDTQYKLAFDYYKSREYDQSLLEVDKIFSIVQDYKNAREIAAFDREAKRKLEAQAEERKRKDAEKQAQLKLQSLLEQASLLIEKHKFTEAEALFPEIELLQPENAAVNNWRKQMIEEKERLEREAEQKKQQLALNRQAWADFENAKVLLNEKRYFDCLDRLDELAEREISDKKFKVTVNSEIKRIEQVIASDRDPLLAEGKQLEGESKYSEAYRAFQKAAVVDPTSVAAPEGMERIRGYLTNKAKSIYAEGVFAESYSDFDTAEKRYREVLDVVPNDDAYFAKAQIRLQKITVFRQPATTSGGSPQ